MAMALRRGLMLALRRPNRFARAAAFLGQDSSLVVTAPESLVRVRDVQLPTTSFSRSYAKKAGKAQKGRGKKAEEEEDEDEDEEEVIVEVDVEEPKRGAKEHMETAMEALASELSKLRTGRATAGMLDHVEIEIDDKAVSLKKVAAVSVSNPQTLTVMPFDTTKVKKVEAAIRLSPLGLNPVSMDQIITVPIPRLTKELSDSMCKLAAKAGEDTKKSIRRGRQTAMDQLKKMASALSKDELKRLEKEVDELTKQYVKSVDDACKKKEAEISKGV